MTKLGRVVKDGTFKSLEQIYSTNSLSMKHQIVDTLVGPSLKDEVMKIMPVQKQTRVGQRTRFNAFVVVGDGNGHVGLGVKCSKEVATAIRGAIILVKLSALQGHGKCGSVTVRMVRAPRGAGIVAARVQIWCLSSRGLNMCSLLHVDGRSQFCEGLLQHKEVAYTWTKRTSLPNKPPVTGSSLTPMGMFLMKRMTLPSCPF